MSTLVDTEAKIFLKAENFAHETVKLRVILSPEISKKFLMKSPVNLMYLSVPSNVTPHVLGKVTICIKGKMNYLK